MYKSVFQKYPERELRSIKTSLEKTRDNTQQVIDRIRKGKGEKKIKEFVKKSGIKDFERNLNFLERSINKIDSILSQK
jgi:hypothetical protein